VAHSPCQGRPGFISATGHAGPVSSVSWSAGDGTILTTGSKDHTILQWKCVYDSAKESGDEGGLSCDDSEVDRDAGHEYPSNAIARKKGDLSTSSSSAGTGTGIGSGVNGGDRGVTTAGGRGSGGGRGGGGGGGGGGNPLEAAQWTSVICPPSLPKDDDQTLPDRLFDLDVRINKKNGSLLQF
jgi:WD40 repeat protein